MFQDSEYCSSASMLDIVEIYIALCSHDNIDKPDPLFVSLHRKPRIYQRFSYLRDRVINNEGLSQIKYIEGDDDFFYNGQDRGNAEDFENHDVHDPEDGHGHGEFNEVDDQGENYDYEDANVDEYLNHDEGAPAEDEEDYVDTSYDHEAVATNEDQLENSEYHTALEGTSEVPNGHVGKADEDDLLDLDDSSEITVSPRKGAEAKAKPENEFIDPDDVIEDVMPAEVVKSTTGKRSGDDVEQMVAQGEPKKRRS